MNERVPGPPTLESLKQQAYRPKRAVITSGMPYANGPVHLGHLAGALVPPDIHARYLRMLIGADKVLFVSGNDDHGSTSELSALKAGQPIREFIDGIHQIPDTSGIGVRSASKISFSIHGFESRTLNDWDFFSWETIGGQ